MAFRQVPRIFSESREFNQFQSALLSILNPALQEATYLLTAGGYANATGLSAAGFSKGLTYQADTLSADVGPDHNFIPNSIRTPSAIAWQVQNMVMDTAGQMVPTTIATLDYAGNLSVSGAIVGTSMTSSILTEDEGVALGAATTLNFTGAGVTASVAGGICSVNITAGVTSPTLVTIEDENIVQGVVDIIDFVGAGVTAIVSGGKAIVTVPQASIQVDWNGAPITTGTGELNFTGNAINSVTQVGPVTTIDTTRSMPFYSELGVLLGNVDELGVAGFATSSVVGTRGLINFPGIKVQDEATPVVATDTINFVGTGVTAINVGGVATITIPFVGGNTLDIQDEGTPLGAATTLNFVGAGVTASLGGAIAQLLIPGITIAVDGTPVPITQQTEILNFSSGAGVTFYGASSGNEVKITADGNTLWLDEGVPVLTSNTLDVTGAGIALTDVGGTATITVGGAAGTVVVQYEGVSVGSKSIIDFRGVGVTATSISGSTGRVTIPGLTTLDEGATATPTTSINFTGAGVTRTMAGTDATVNVPGLPIIRDEGSAVTTTSDYINFVGAGVTASSVGGVATVTVPTQIPQIRDEGSVVTTTSDYINFVGSSVVASSVGGVATVTISGVGGTVVTKDEGTTLGAAATLDFVGEGVTASFAGSTATITVPGLITQDEGAGAHVPSTMNFTGGGVTRTAVGAVDTVNVPGLYVLDEGGPLGYFSSMNFTGSGVTTTNVGGTATVTIPDTTALVPKAFQVLTGTTTSVAASGTSYGVQWLNDSFPFTSVIKVEQNGAYLPILTTLGGNSVFGQSPFVTSNGTYVRITINNEFGIVLPSGLDPNTGGIIQMILFYYPCPGFNTGVVADGSGIFNWTYDHLTTTQGAYFSPHATSIVKLPVGMGILPIMMFVIFPYPGTVALPSFTVLNSNPSIEMEYLGSY